MGYKRKPRQYKLKFQGDEYEGFECLMGSLSVDEFIEMTNLAMRFQNSQAGNEDVGRMFEIVANQIISWNLEDDEGKPIIPDAPNLRAQDFDFVMTIQMSWMNAMASVPAPLLSGSDNGRTTPEDMTTALANLSRSQAS